MTIKELGDLKRKFKPGLENVIGGIVIGLLMIAAGCALLYYCAWIVIDSGGDLPLWGGEGEHGKCWGVAAVAAVVGTALVIAGVWFTYSISSMSTFTVYVAQNGLMVTEGKSIRVIGWDEILSVQETFIYARPEVLHSTANRLIPKLESKSFKLQVKHGDPVEFDSNSIGSPNTLARMIKEETDRREVPWEIVEEHAN